jgi:hypothetical protein
MSSRHYSIGVCIDRGRHYHVANMDVEHELTPDQLMALVRKRYLDSRDFNGLHLYGSAVPGAREAAISLVSEGKIQVVSGADYMNIHIRPWPSKRTVDSQLDDLRRLDTEQYGICLYPTAAGMKGVRLPRRLTDRPFQVAMARGRGTLELAFFNLDVLEQYRNDARYMFSFGDAGAYMSIHADAYEDDQEPEHDKVSLSHIGFAYDLDGFDVDDLNSPIVRRVAAFYCDLAKLSPEHQQRWRTYQVPDAKLRPHPLWWGSQMGRWPDGIGPIERLFVELAAINELTARAFNQPLFASTDRPNDLGWLLRPSQREWDEFVLQMDKALSENLQHALFNKANVPKRDKDDQVLGTLSRLELFMTQYGISNEVAKDALEPLREVRRARQAPAHKLRQNINDRTFVHRQLSLLWDINDTLVGMRDWLATHPANRDWVHPNDDLKDYRM